MIAHGIPIYVALEPVGMRLGAERLGGLVRERMPAEPRSRALFVFAGKRGHTMKVLTWDGTGTIVIHKKLDAGRFGVPPLKVTIDSTLLTRLGTSSLDGGGMRGSSRVLARAGVSRGITKPRRGTDVAATLYTILESANLHEIDPAAYSKRCTRPV
ncbi:MAG: isftu1 [Myxococcales bacterium]|nr:isftu1 [Myxococcales bacterium]